MGTTASSVKIGVVTFGSRAQTKAWMDGNSIPARSSLFFLDAMSVLALMHSSSESAKAAAEFASVTKKVGSYSLLPVTRESSRHSPLSNNGMAEMDTTGSRSLSPTSSLSLCPRWGTTTALAWQGRLC